MDDFEDALEVAATRHVGPSALYVADDRDALVDARNMQTGWFKEVRVKDLDTRTTRHRGRGLVEWFFVLAAAAYNLIRIPKILAAMA